MSKTVPLEVVPPAQALELAAAERINAAYADAQQSAGQAIRKVVVCGLMLLEQKHVLSHGDFGPWLAEHCPRISHKTACAWMNTARAVNTLLAEIQPRGFLPHDAEPKVKFAAGDHLPPGVNPLSGKIALYEALSMEDAPDTIARIQAAVFALVDGSSQKQLVMQLKAPPPESKPRKLSPREKSAQAKALAQEEARMLATRLRLFQETDAVSRLGKELIRELDAELKAFTAFWRPIAKGALK
ncbi:MAG: hypothetical protein VW338_08630 [Rhodospirillaceae bacterium]